ncbi:unnamed protein product, partial [Bubo scandiacus]
CAKEDTDIRVSLWIAASEFMTDGKPTEELKSFPLNSLHSGTPTNTDVPEERREQ